MGLQLSPNWSAIEPQLGRNSCPNGVRLRLKYNPIGYSIARRDWRLGFREERYILQSSLFNTLEFDFFSKKFFLDFNEFDSRKHLLKMLKCKPFPNLRKCVFSLIGKWFGAAYLNIKVCCNALLYIQLRCMSPYFIFMAYAD